MCDDAHLPDHIVHEKKFKAALSEFVTDCQNIASKDQESLASRTRDLLTAANLVLDKLRYMVISEKVEENFEEDLQAVLWGAGIAYGSPGWSPG